MKLATRWEVKVDGKERSIQLYDKDNKKITGKARWEGIFNCSCNQLTSLKGSPIEVNGSFYCSGNKLTSLKGGPSEVGGSFLCYDNNLISEEHKPKTYSPKVKQRIFNNLYQKNILLIDGIMSELISHKGNVYKVRIYGKKEISYVVKQGKYFSHGLTLEEAKESLIFKVSDRDKSEFKDLDVNTKRGIKSLIGMYRTITGACESGVRDFCSNLDLKKRYSITEVIKMTKGHYGNREFDEFYK